MKTVAKYCSVCGSNIRGLNGSLHTCLRPDQIPCGGRYCPYCGEWVPLAEKCFCRVLSHLVMKDKDVLEAVTEIVLEDIRKEILGYDKEKE